MEKWWWLVTNNAVKRCSSYINILIISIWTSIGNVFYWSLHSFCRILYTLQNHRVWRFKKEITRDIKTLLFHFRQIGIIKKQSFEKNLNLFFTCYFFNADFHIANEWKITNCAFFKTNLSPSVFIWLSPTCTCIQYTVSKLIKRAFEIIPNIANLVFC